MTNNARTRRSYSFLAVLAVTATTLGAAEYTWDKTAGTLDWNTPANWTSDTKPGTADTARFDATGLVAGDTVLLGANQTIKTLRFNAAPNNVTISGGGLYSLTLLSGYIQGNAGGAVTALTIDAPIILGAAGVIEAQGQFGAATKLTLAGAISDGGSGFGVTFGNQSGQDYILKGSNTYSGNTVVPGRTVTIDGPNGSILNSKLILRQSNAATSTLVLGNTVDVNTNRLSDTLAIGFENSGGSIRLDGNATKPVIESAGVLELTSGTALLAAAYVKDSGSGLELKFSGLTRSPGTALQVMRHTTVDASNWNDSPLIKINGLADGFLPYASTPFYNPSHIYVEGGQLKRATAYTALPASGGDSTVLYQADAGKTLTGNVDARGLMIRNDGANATVNLDAYDLRLADGSVGFRAGAGTGKSHTIQSSGGRLIFGKNEVVVFAAGLSGSILTISAPIMSDAAGPYHMVIPVAHGIGRIALTGEDQIHDYVHLTVPSTATLELGGPSDRTFSGKITGQMNLIKSGTGTLRITGTDFRGGGTMTVTGGRLKIGSTNPLRLVSYNDSGILITNAVVEIESGIVWAPKFTIQANTTLTGDGKLNVAKTIGNLVHVAPGHAVGTLKTADLTFSTGSHLDWELGAGTTTAGTDYDLLRVEGALVLPATMTVHIYDAADGAATVKDKSFTVVEWTGTDPATNPAWTFVNHSETTLDTTDAVITRDTVNNKLVLTGLKNRRPNTTIVVVK